MDELKEKIEFDDSSNNTTNQTEILRRLNTAETKHNTEGDQTG